ncbi:MAG: DUF1566 domain-containing protein [Thermodesulfobacteriota bacterium]
MHKPLLSCAILLLAASAQAAPPQPAISTQAPARFAPKVSPKISKASPSQLKVQQFQALEVNGDRMVRDNINNLVWEVKAPSDNLPAFNNPNDPDNTYSWHDPQPENGGEVGSNRPGGDTADFLAAMNSRRYGGFNNWRLPSKEELETLITTGDNEPHINLALFPNTKLRTNVVPYQHWAYWTKTTSFCNPQGGCAWAVKFQMGKSVGGLSKSGKKLYVRAVRR